MPSEMRLSAKNIVSYAKKESVQEERNMPVVFGKWRTAVR